MFTAIDLAKYIVTRCMKNGNPISNLQLQKILFYVQKHFLALGEVAFHDRIEAWQFGPVVPVVYNKFCGSGAMPIARKYKTNINGSTNGIDDIVDEKCILDPWVMVDDTHQKDGAWYHTYHKARNSKEIPIERIRQMG